MFDLQEIRETETENMAEKIVTALKTACDASMPAKRKNNRRKENYWWNDTIANLRKQCLRNRRLYQRSRLRSNIEERREAYHQARKELQKAINISKSQCFKNLCKEVDSNPWGKAYQIVMLRLKGRRTPQITCLSLIDNILQVLFPIGDPLEETNFHSTQNETEVMGEEILKLCPNIGDKKAPGLDLIPNKALKLGMHTRPALFEKLFTKCLIDGVFPTNWKRQKLILIPKPGKVLGDPRSYRPICLLDSIGKCLEGAIYNRLLEVVESANGL